MISLSVSVELYGLGMTLLVILGWILGSVLIVYMVLAKRYIREYYTWIFHDVALFYWLQWHLWTCSTRWVTFVSLRCSSILNSTTARAKRQRLNVLTCISLPSSIHFFLSSKIKNFVSAEKEITRSTLW